jgi:hypothetical protein
MGRSIIQKILYKRRKFLTKKRIKAAAEIVLKLLPAVIINRPTLVPLMSALNELVQTIDDNTAPQSVNVSNEKLCQRIKRLQAQIDDAPTQDADKLRQKIDVLHELLLENATLEGTP